MGGPFNTLHGYLLFVSLVNIFDFSHDHRQQCCYIFCYLVTQILCFSPLLTFASLDTIPHRFLKDPEGCAWAFLTPWSFQPPSVAMFQNHSHMLGYDSSTSVVVARICIIYLLLPNRLVQNSVAINGRHHPFTDCAAQDAGVLRWGACGLRVSLEAWALW